MLIGAAMLRRGSTQPLLTFDSAKGDGRMIVRGDPDPESGVVRWDVYSADFSPEGYFRLPDVDRVLLVIRDSLLLAEARADGLQTVRWRVIRHR